MARTNYINIKIRTSGGWIETLDPFFQCFSVILDNGINKFPGTGYRCVVL